MAGIAQQKIRRDNVDLEYMSTDYLYAAGIPLFRASEGQGYKSHSEKTANLMQS
jgi:hypothetical protein